MVHQILEAIGVVSEILRTETILGGELEYSTFSSFINVEDQLIKTYGICIRRSTQTIEECEFVEDITTHYEIINELYYLLINNFVTPCTLKDVVYDYLVEKY